MKLSKLFAPRQNRVAIGRLTLILTVTLFPADHSILSADWAIFTNTGSHWSAYSNKIVFKSFSIRDQVCLPLLQEHITHTLLSWILMRLVYLIHRYIPAKIHSHCEYFFNVPN